MLADWGGKQIRTGSTKTPHWLAENVRPYLQVGITCFVDPSGAAAALPYVVQNLQPADAQQELPMTTTVGDESREFVTERTDGLDLTLLARLVPPDWHYSSTLLTNGEQRFDPVAVADFIIAGRTLQPCPTATDPTRPGHRSAMANALPSDLPACLQLVEDERLDYATLITRFPGTPDAAEQLEQFGWTDGVHRQYACDPLPETGLNWLDLSVHRFQNAEGASAAVPYFAHARTVGTQLEPMPVEGGGADSTAAITGPSENGYEFTLYHSVGPLLFRVSAVAANRAPQTDVEQS